MREEVLPAILFEPEGYDLSGQKLMGRQAAGHAFLRGAVNATGRHPLTAYTPHQRSAKAFDAMVKAIKPEAATHWIPANRLDLLAQQGHLYLPGPGLADAARTRLRAGPGAYALCGVTHTTASHGAMDAIKDMLTQAVMPWDALICTSASVRSTVDVVLGKELDYLRWRWGRSVTPTLPLLPVIPLGVHASDFESTDHDRDNARRAIGLQADEVVALYVGRLSFHAKAHPHAMYEGLQQAARQTGRRVVLVQCGWFANEFIENAYKDAARQVCPDVRTLFLDGKDAAVRRQCWAAADFFISLSDNIQETFGLTPIEAMAAGLPVVVTDWDGYKDTIRDGVDGFRIPTAMPAAGFGDRLALDHESGQENYDRYCGLACLTVSVDQRTLVECLGALITRPELRRHMGDMGRRQALARFDWAVVFGAYQALWAEQTSIRLQARAASPAAATQVVDAGRLDPFVAFDGYATHRIDGATLVSRLPGYTDHQLRQTLGLAMFNYVLNWQTTGPDVERLWPVVPARAVALRDLAKTTNLSLACVVWAVSLLAKIGAVALSHHEATA